ncbi:MAG: NOB1 family endonuclease [Halobacteriota archaeon]
MMDNIVHVMDSSAIFRKKRYEQMVTVPEVVEEIKDEDSKLFLSLIDIKIEEPSEGFVSTVNEVAARSGDIHKLSQTDIKLIAKALELEGVLVTDDYAIQNVAGILGIKVDNILQPTIFRTYKWIRVCKGCKRVTEHKICPICGSETSIKKEK